MSAETLARTIADRLRLAPPLGHAVNIDLGDDGVIHLPATGGAAEDAGSEADTTLEMSAANLEALLSGKLGPTMAYMTGKLKVRGSMGVALKLSSLLEE